MTTIIDGTNGITFPDTSVQPKSGYGPAFSVYQSVTSTYANATPTKVTLQTKEFDTASAFDNTTNYRFQPLTAGYYQINGAVSGNAASGYFSANIYKNGTLYKVGASYTTSGVTPDGSVSSVVYLNGSTDYVELWVNAATGGSTNTGIASTYFNGIFVRGA